LPLTGCKTALMNWDLILTGLKKRILSTVSTVAAMELKVDWENVNNVVAKARETSLKNLRESIEA